MANSNPSVATSYKKQDGSLILSADRKSITWTPTAQGASNAPIVLSVAEISNLQQTPATSAKVSTKVVVQKPNQTTPENFVFTFTSPNARNEQSTITESIRKAIEASKSQNGAGDGASTAAAGPPGDGQSGAMAFAQTVSSTPRTDPLYDDARLATDANLQRSLLHANAQLRQRFNESLAEKPEGITMSQFSAQFWSTRVHLLRAHAVGKSQSHGVYNVLSEVKPKNVDGTARLNLSKEQIVLIFKQHPLVKRVYDESVPPMQEKDFWSRFFVSRLCKKLRGEKITEIDSTDKDLDKYLNQDEYSTQRRDLEPHVPHIIDLEGNENDITLEKGNRPDWTMRPQDHDRVPILRVLNRMSEKMMTEVAPSDNLYDPVGMDEETFNQLRLRDLDANGADNRIILNIKDQRRFLAAGVSHVSKEAARFAKMQPQQVVDNLRAEFGTEPFDLNAALNVRPQSDEDSDEEDDPRPLKDRIGSRAGRTAATNDMIGTIRQRRNYTDVLPSGMDSANFGAVPLTDTGLSQDIIDSLLITHNTTIEFLHYFWVVFHSGDADRAGELQKLVETLDKSLDRIQMIADRAEQERGSRVAALQKQEEERMRRKGRRGQVNVGAIKGGAAVVNQLLAPTKRAIDAARVEFEAALRTQLSKAVGDSGDRDTPMTDR
ncbi:hypothetical protein P152DRAFT_507581 [Eremomyces bilateralis CBS 781.70]|uniref:BSD domain-containing protein n=1 Tax=Eremomyces bilateralis CBS 781.70 TaxID=1392243 RepID=A0A6G1G2M9_9PEZI|nr:uncharacterized protein P152DRAFT_507581 [Eremomyces bilateralis CBS 781.70]KAF1812242.1 hypothetical protein P152DRAFT_507581 [Eremomyces bilateralis CBS 781.70]